jgi:hypothetical protein
VLDIDTDHRATVSKTRCSALDGWTGQRPGVDLARPLLAWLRAPSAKPGPSTSVSAPQPSPAAPSPLPATVPAGTSTAAGVLAAVEGEGGADLGVSLALTELGVEVWDADRWRKIDGKGPIASIHPAHAARLAEWLRGPHGIAWRDAHREQDQHEEVAP